MTLTQGYIIFTKSPKNPGKQQFKKNEDKWKRRPLTPYDALAGKCREKFPQLHY